MEHGEHRFKGAFAGAGMDIGGDAAAVVANGAGTIRVEAHLDIAAVAC